jgi:hypothetical protein
MYVKHSIAGQDHQIWLLSTYSIHQTLDHVYFKEKNSMTVSRNVDKHINDSEKYLLLIRF